jgi:hypothetical protein
MVVFLIGAPRSGTTILSQCLGRHAKIAHLYEPYYIWDYYTGFKDSDKRTPEDLTPRSRAFIRKNFKLFSRKTAKPIILDKLPENCFRIPFLASVFPDAKWIYLYRDGRDVTLSMHREWKRRQLTVLKKDYQYYYRVVRRVFQLQPFWRFRGLQFLYELKSGRSINPNFYLNKSKWKGRPGWGPRFDGWEDYFNRYEVIEFNAYQWLHSVESAQYGLSNITATKQIEIRYEDFIRNPQDILARVLRFLDLAMSDDFFQRIPPINAHNFGKWETAFSAKQLGHIGPILNPKLIELGYVHDNQWYRQIDE